MILLSFSRGDMGNNPSPVSGSHQSNLMKSAAENDCKPGACQRFLLFFFFYPQVQGHEIEIFYFFEIQKKKKNS